MSPKIIVLQLLKYNQNKVAMALDIYVQQTNF